MSLFSSFSVSSFVNNASYFSHFWLYLATTLSLTFSVCDAQRSSSSTALKAPADSAADPTIFPKLAGSAWRRPTPPLTPRKVADLRESSAALPDRAVEGKHFLDAFLPGHMKKMADVCGPSALSRYKHSSLLA
eukprot:CAMPEP_0185321616 /NCGR_PEP_ID=MMETSP1363-20130426/57558_1 /TAXON_ID=38817 /ORGANISM="Gephyrocapsa oceanica, Strain RCC1303" /LENGTH=132 /DNA_ID=CAMNT_0027920121 /DNA_START=350 /DNA_END=750 /DNA_ORIENTATION=+